jgi:hypothetical protein
MAPSTFYISQGATAPAITATLIDQYGNVANLTGASVRFVMTNAFYGNTVNAAATIVNAGAGQVSYSWGTTDTTNPGLFSCQWQVIFSSGAQETYPQGYYNQVSISPALNNGFPDIIEPSVIFNTIWNSISAPTSIQGNNGDFWYDIVTGYFYGPKAMGTWPAGNLISPATIPLNQFAAPTGNLNMANFSIINLADNNFVGSVNTSQVISALVTGDANSRWQVQASGAMNWGPGNASTDTNLYRALAGTLKTDDSLSIGNQLTVTSFSTFNNTVTANAQVASARTTDSSAFNATYTTTSNVTNAAFAYTAVASTGRFLSTAVTGDTIGRFSVDVNGTMSWGSGSATRDVTLGRTSVGVLSVTGDLAVSGPLYPNSGTATNGSAPILTPTFAASTAAQLSDTSRDYMVYLQVGTPGSGFSLLIGPTSTPANTIFTSATPTAGELLSFRLPAGWYVKWAGSSSSLIHQIAIGC